MSKWTPDVGELFYPNCIFSFDQKVKDTNGNTLAVIKSSDRSYCGRIYHMVALDDTSFIADIVYGEVYGDKRRLLLRTDFDPIPVGPNVAASLDLQI